MLIVLAGPLMNLLLGFVLMTVLVFLQGTLVSTTVAEFREDATSNQWLQAGDVIVEVDGTRVHTGNEMVYEIMNQGYEPIDLVVIRKGNRITLEGVTFPTVEDSGITLGDYDFIPYAEQTNLPNLCKHAFWRSVSNVKMIYDSLFGLVSGRYGMEAVSGPVGVAQVVGDAAKIGWDSFLFIVSVLSVNLGVFNLLPVPALDGGRFAFLALEGGFGLFCRGLLRRDEEARGRFMRRLRQIEGYINSVSLILLFGLMIFVTAKDILNLFV
jgi:regulator of sigma E protease